MDPMSPVVTAHCQIYIKKSLDPCLPPFLICLTPLQECTQDHSVGGTNSNNRVLRIVKTLRMLKILRLLRAVKVVQ